MGIVLQSQPSAYGLAYNDNPWVMRSTAYTATQRFKISVLPTTWPVDAPLATYRVYPRQGVDVNGVVTNDRAYFDPSRILQASLAPDISIPSANHAGLFASNNMHKEYALFIEEEDKNAQGAYVSGDHIFSIVKSVWNGARKTRAWLDFDYTDYDMDAATGDHKFLTDGTLTRYVNTGQSAFVYFLTTAVGATGVIEVYDSDDVLLRTGNITAINGTVTYANSYQRFACGPYDLANLDSSILTGATPANILTGASYYKVYVKNLSENNPVTFNLDAQCGKYTPIRLHWLNRLGGFDAFNFNLKSTSETDVKREAFEKQHHDFSGTSWAYTAASRGVTDYDVQSQEKLTVNTGYLTEAESTWMGDLATSPVIYQELNNALIAVSLDVRSITKQTSLNDKLMQYEFDLDYSLTDNRQRG